MPENLENSAVATGLEKVIFFFFLFFLNFILFLNFTILY